MKTRIFVRTELIEGMVWVGAYVGDQGANPYKVCAVAAPALLNNTEGVKAFLELVDICLESLANELGLDEPEVIFLSDCLQCVGNA